MPVSVTVNSRRQRSGVLPVQEGDLNGHTPFVRELEGVAHQVEQDLSQPGRVPLQVRRHVGRNDELQAQLLVPRQGAEGLFHAGQDVSQDKLLIVEFHPARLHPGEVQDVAQKLGQPLAGGQGGLHVFSVLGGQIVQGQELEHAHGPVERGAQLMAHVGQELGLGLVGGLGLPDGLFQFGLNPFAVGDVLDSAHALERGPVLRHIIGHSAVGVSVLVRTLGLEAEIQQVFRVFGGGEGQLLPMSPAVFGVNHPEKFLHGGRFLPNLHAQELEKPVGPEGLVCLHIPLEAADAGQFLGLVQPRLAVRQFFAGPPPTPD